VAPQRYVLPEREDVLQRPVREQVLGGLGELPATQLLLS
jgi:hypothetical protein